MRVMNGRAIWIWITIGVFVIGAISSMSLQWNQVNMNTEDIDYIEKKQEEQTEILIRIDENVKNLKEDIKELKE